jgi:enoyl-CoA hydratase
MDISGDFNEGIRALLIDKTNDAKWNPATVDEVVSSGLTHKFFQPHPNDLHLPITSPKL